MLLSILALLVLLLVVVAGIAPVREKA